MGQRGRSQLKLKIHKIAMLWEKFIAVNVYTGKNEKSQINNWSHYLKKMKKKKSKVNTKPAKESTKDPRRNQWNWKQKNSEEKA